MERESFYLEEYLSGLSTLPEDVRKTFSKMLELDVKNQEITKEIDNASEDYLRKVEEKRMNPRRRKQEMEKIQKMYDDAKTNSDTKVKLAIDTYELVDKHIRKLDSDLLKFEEEMKQAGGRLSQTESEDEDRLNERKERKKEEEGSSRRSKEEIGRRDVVSDAAQRCSNR